MDDLDKFNLSQFNQLYPDVAARAIKVYQDMFRIHGARMRCTHAWRSIEEQQKLYEQGRQRDGRIVTWSMPGDSLHHYYCAFDSCFSGNDPYLERLARQDPEHAKLLWNAFGTFCRSHGLKWGGDWGDEKQDKPHAQLTYGLKLAQIKDIYHLGGKDAIFNKFNELSAGWPGVRSN